MVDFEKGLQIAIKNNFKETQIDGCFFHFSKLLSKAKEFGLCKKDDLKKAKIIFILKLIAFMHPEKIEEYYSIDDDKFNKMVNILKKHKINIGKFPKIGLEWPWPGQAN